MHHRLAKSYSADDIDDPGQLLKDIIALPVCIQHRQLQQTQC